MLARASVFGLIMLFTAPASAAQFYIVQDTEKQSCAIVQEAPTDQRHMLVGDGAYGDDATAAAEMKTILACNPRDASSGAAQNPTTTPAKQ
jgi:hypothetical protein